MTLNKVYIENDEIKNNDMFGMWLYLMSDCILFATMFSVHIIISSHVILYTGFFNLWFVFIETLVLLLSSVTYGLLSISARYKKTFFVCFFLLITFALGLIFIMLESYEFYHLWKLGYKPQNNGFLSSFFTLVGLHGIHVVLGLVWMLGLFFQILKFHINKTIYIRILCLGLFWHFLDIIWVCLFTVVYLMRSI
ncbi:cytochrome c oxidase subunit 3 [Buchnera aphidicola]|uniref:cytochrome c oxidase subunit 3 n=1 Tax=Buchnera aphidicola TaxID=9 RepID=UPI003463A3D3